MALAWIDGHLDLAYIAMQSGDIRREHTIGEDRCVSLPALRRGNVGVIAATILWKRS